jgi:hypothetical protein
MFVMGLTCTWAGAGCNSPIFAEIVPDELRSTIYAFDRCGGWGRAGKGWHGKGKRGVLRGRGWLCMCTLHSINIRKSNG